MWIASLTLTATLALYVAFGQWKYNKVRACVWGTGFFTVGCYLDIIFSLIMAGLGEDGFSLFLQSIGILMSKSIITAVLLVGITLELGDGSGDSSAGRDGNRSKGIEKEYNNSEGTGKNDSRSKGIEREYDNSEGTGKNGSRSKGIEKEYDSSKGTGKSDNRSKEIGKAGSRDKSTKMTGRSTEDINDNHAGQNWQYLDGLTIGITLFFLILAIITCQSVYDVSCLKNRIHLAWILSFFLAVLLIYIGSYYLHRKKQCEKKRRFRETAGNHEADVYLENVEDRYQRTRELWHDLKNHITLLEMLLEEEKYTQLKDYLRIFAADVDSLTLPVKSGNLVVDALLADKMAQAGKKDISFRLSLCNLTDIPLKPNEICGIFGNLLDNALEACNQVSGKRYIVIECEEKEYYYYIRIRNTADGFCHSAKTDRRNRVGHGLGLRSVERIVHGCGGELAVEKTENQFIVAVQVPRKIQ